MKVKTETPAIEPQLSSFRAMILRCAVLCALLILTAIVYASALRIPDEDAYISFVYSETLRNGGGLTYRGILVEGFTNPLWVVAISIVSSLTGFSEPASALALCAVCGLASSGLIFLILASALPASLSGLRDPIAGLLTALLLLNPSLLYWNTAGTENAMFFLFLAAGLLAAARHHDYGVAASFGMLSLVRSDAGGLAVVGFGGYALLELLRDRTAGFRRFIGPAVLLISIPLSLLAFRAFYFHALAPNTATTKVFMIPVLVRVSTGFSKMIEYLLESGILIPVIFGAVLGRFKLFRKNALSALILCLVVFQVLYLILIGGDVPWKPHFRFSTFLYPIAIIALMGCWNGSFRAPVLSGVIASLLTSLIPLHILTLPAPGVLQKRWRDVTNDGIPSDSFHAAGLLLRNIEIPQGQILASSAGKVAYYSGRRVVDLTGLADHDWRDGDPKTRLQLLTKSDAWVSENVLGRPSGAICRFGGMLRDTGYALRAIILQPGNVHGHYQEIFLRTGNSLPTSIGEAGQFKSSWATFNGEPLAIYRDSLLPQLSDSEVLEMIQSSAQCPPSVF